MVDFNTLNFFRWYFNIPREKKLKWCIIRERKSERIEMRLGGTLVGTPYYIDVAARRFFMECSDPAISRKVFPAMRISSGKQYVYGEDETKKTLEYPENYIEDIYKMALYDTLPQNIL